MAAAAAVSSVDESVKALGDSFDGIPVIDVGAWLKKDGAEVDAETIATECAKAAASLRKYGCVFARDPRVDSKDNDRFLDTLEKYFETPEDARMKDTHPELSYQVGATPAFTELPRNHCDRMKAYKDTDKPLSECPPEKDCKWRFFWRIGERPAETKFGELNAAPVVPEGIPEWTDVMNTWGGKLLGCVTCVAQMAARGFGLEDDAFSSRMDMGPHLLAPTATDLKRFGKEGTVCAGYHRDLNFLTIHGKSRFPGLYVWTREGKKLAVRVPEGCLLVQAGIQVEYIIAGHVMAGYHEVVVTPQTLEAVERATAAGRSIWRISSTLFSHMASDGMLEPIGKFASEEAAKDYPPVLVGD
jgi:isopenicillin N synthase-like dioxygenase